MSTYQIAQRQLAALQAAREKARDIWYAWINQADDAELEQYAALHKALGKTVGKCSPADLVSACQGNPRLVQQLPQLLRERLQEANLLPWKGSICAA